MPDTPKIPETAPGPTPPATSDAPSETAAAAPAAAVAPAPRPQPSVADTARLLSEHFPALFGAGVIKPIKLRIQADIHQRAPGVFTKKALSLFLQRHTTGTAYLRALVAEGATRTDLDGQPAGDIAAEHRDAAAAELERRRAIVEARKQAGREAARASRRDAHPPRPPRPPQPPADSQSAEAAQAAVHAAGKRPATRDARTAPPDGPARRDRAARPPRPGQAPRRPPQPLPTRARVGAREQAPVNSPALPLTPVTPEQAAEAEARRQRALLLRSFEQSPLSKANFGALKGLSEDALDALLSQARQERGTR
ncbi:MAG: ProQ/FinO family protein [Rhizobacter sp.]|nr:ProQ/FinO family protein [Rhizobacter sp.]